MKKRLITLTQTYGPLTLSLVSKREGGKEYGHVTIKSKDGVLWSSRSAKRFKQIEDIRADFWDTLTVAKRIYKNMPAGQLKLEAHLKELRRKENIRAKKLGISRKSNPVKKAKKLSKGTKDKVAEILEFMGLVPDTEFPSALFQPRRGGRSGSIAPAIKYLKEMGMIEIAAKNITGGNLYRATDAFVHTRIHGAKSNPRRRRSKAKLLKWRT